MDKIREIEKLEIRNGLLSRYAEYYKKNYNISYFAFMEAVSRNEARIRRLREAKNELR